jgi:ABC-2 type transport system ATP-binding protein
MDSAAGLAVEVESLHVCYGSILAVDNLALHVPTGSLYGLVGPRGAGKSTVLRVLATVQTCRAAVLRVVAFELQTQPRRVRALIGYLPAEGGFAPALSVAEYLAFHGDLAGLTEREIGEIEGDLLELVELTDRRQTPIGALSGDEQRRLGLVRSLLHDPKVLLLDEPFAGMEPASREKIGAVLQDLCTLGTTILCAISSDSPGDVVDLCTHIGIMADGRVTAEGPCDAMREHLVARSMVDA